MKYSLYIILSSLIYAKLSACQVMIDNILLEGTCKGTLKHGKFLGYYNNSVIAWEVHYKDNYLHGPFKHFYPDGKLHFSGFYKKSQLHNTFQQYNLQNQVLKAYFKNGVLHNWLYVFDNNKKIEALKYYYGKLIKQEYLD